ncbi:MAG: DUF2064 domain-containing protein [Rhodobacteraceae bacterium]|nr:DUF2064 domain-containing protein [Paracoccaceae bacterium]MYF47291.1 DUF2064 domain-containing protein [Paracoccaceae bacterium]MYI90436.1 DUF2064 domain-containing protein [Paracoccaceae bacterium]
MFNASRIISVRPDRTRLVILVKEPVPGTVKTRLAKELGTIDATKWYRNECRKTINRLARDPRWDTYLAVSPDKAGMSSRAWTTQIPRIAQGSGHLGSRLKQVFRQMLPGSTIIIGSDIPGIKASQIATTAKAMQKYDAYLGPSPDGGFWLIGHTGRRSLSSKALENVRWSTEFAMDDTINSLGQFSVGIGEVMSDVDNLADLYNNPHTRL